MNYASYPVTQSGPNINRHMRWMSPSTVHLKLFLIQANNYSKKIKKIINEPPI